MWPIVRDAVAQASDAIKVQFRWIVVSWFVMLALQSWDSRDGRGAAGVAEFFSAVLGITGLPLPVQRLEHGCRARPFGSTNR